MDATEICSTGARREDAVAIAGVRGALSLCGERFDGHDTAVSYVHRAHVNVAFQLAQTR